MAEVAIPMAALGIMYILSNQSKEPEPITEGFDNSLPNVKRMPNNYPIEDLKDIKHSVSKYDGKKSGVDQFYKNQNYSEARKQSIQSSNNFTSLTGQSMNVGDLQHNNMVPFFGSNVSQQSAERNNSTLNLYTGTGQEQIVKREQAEVGIK